MEGHGNLMHNFPSTFRLFNSFPSLSIIHGCIPGKGSVANVAFDGVTPARFDIIIPPVSVCHHVSTIGISFSPIFLLYQFQASSFIGSPTVPRTLRDLKSYGLTYFNPLASSALIAVGAV